MQKGIIRYNKEVEVLNKVEGGWRVRETDGDKVTEQTITYEPLPVDGWKYKEGALIKKENKFFTLKHYTVYVNNNVAVYAYTAVGVTRFDDGMVYESDVEERYEFVVDSPFLSEEEIEKLNDRLYKETSPTKEKIKNFEEEIKNLEQEVSDKEKEFDVRGKCCHKWELDYEEEINEGKTTEKAYSCSVCGEEDKHYWHKLSW